jgi:anti-sigma B factor antagonist
VTSPRSHSFSVVDVRIHGTPGVAVGGEVDLAAATELELALDSAIRESRGDFVLDLCELELLDSTGLRQILRARAWLAREERALAVVCPPGPVRRLFEHAGIADLLFLYDTPEEAAAALVPREAPQHRAEGSDHSRDVTRTSAPRLGRLAPRSVSPLVRRADRKD